MGPTAMLIRAQDLDPQVFHAVMAGASAAFSQPDPPEALKRLREEDSRRFRPDRRWFAAVGLGSPLLGLLAAGGTQMAGLPPTAVGLASIGAVLAGLFAGGFGLWRSWSRRASVLHSDLLAGLLPLIELERAERAYCEALVTLAKPDLHVDDATAGQFLVDLNGLMEHYRALGAGRLEMEALLEHNSPAQIESERTALAEKTAETSDLQARQDLETGLRLCEERLENSRAL
jgi:hypothetical protein